MKKLSGITITSDIKSLLISGGVNTHGIVPFLEKKDKILSLREKGIKINLHPGVKIDKRTARLIKEIADVVSFDFICDEKTIHEVYKGFYKMEDYLTSLENLLEENIKVVPHILCGILYGKIKGEKKALLTLKDMGFDNVVILVLKPPGDYSIDPPEPEEVVRIGKDVDISLTLGCMRPGGNYRKKLDILAAKSNFNTIVMPHPECVKYCMENSYITGKGDQCCVF